MTLEARRTTYNEIRSILDLLLCGRVASMGLIAAISENLDAYAIDAGLCPACCDDEFELGDIRVRGAARIEYESGRFIIRRGHDRAAESWDDFDGWGYSGTYYVTERLARKAALRAGLGEKIPLRGYEQE